MKGPGTDTRMLLLGIGNCGRADDGLGWAFVDRMDSMGYDFCDIEYRYQLQVEDAELISGYDLVIFVDASQDTFGEGFDMAPCLAAGHAFFSTHAQAPAAIVHLANELYHSFPTAYLLAISGKEWALQSSLSIQGEKNLEAAVSFFTGRFLPALPLFQDQGI